MTVALDGKKVLESLNGAIDGQGEDGQTEVFARFNTPKDARVWINPQHVAAVEDRPDLS